ncbi:MAG: hypothetical protein ABS46_18035 [Cytophagaceae bacterium SCN 52-12]|nr:MAG: hypothetical protein ABS46_18035 [Cytophagaceae bacterium SCN 52-12]
MTAGCSGAGCSGGITYTWSGNGSSGTGSPKNLTAPATPGTYTYTVTASKSGCANKTANISITVPPAAGSCYTLSFKGDNPKYVSNHNGIVKVKAADNSDSQIWKMETVGSHFKLVSQGSPNGTKIGYVLGVRNQGSSEENIIDLQTSASGDHQLWSRTQLTGDDINRYKIERKGTAYRISSYRMWGQGNLSDGESDLAIYSDPGDVFGWNKWTFTPKTCPGPVIEVK